MHVTTIDRYSPEPGTVLQWVVAPGSPPIRSAVPPSFNQNFHLSAPDGPSVWLAGGFDVDGPIDGKALEQAFSALLDRHGALRNSFVRNDDGIERQLHQRVQLKQLQDSSFDTSAEVREHLRSALDTHCRRFGASTCLLSAIDRPGRSTVFCGFDHAHVDAYSIAIIVAELHHLYSGFLADASGLSIEPLPDVGDFIDYCAAEAIVEKVSPDDRRMRAWLEFLRKNDCAPPSFPLDLGVVAGSSAAQRSDVRHLLDADDTRRLAEVCQRANTSMFAGVLTAMAQCACAPNESAHMPVLVPVHTRRSEHWHHAVGWFTTNVPIEVAAGTDFIDALGRNGGKLRNALQMGEIPLAHVVEVLGGLKATRSDVFMTSYVDYRKLPGAELHGAIDAHHVSNVTAADDAQFWFSRTDDGIALRSRYPDTPTGRATMTSFLDDLSRVLRSAVQ